MKGKCQHDNLTLPVVGPVGKNQRNAIAAHKDKKKMPSLIEIGDISPQCLSTSHLARIDSMASAKQHFRFGYNTSSSQIHIGHDLTNGSNYSRNPNFGPNLLEKTSFQAKGEADDSSSMFSLQNTAGNHGKILYLTHDKIIGDTNQVYWTDLQYYQYEREESFYSLQENFKRKCKIKNCLIIEPVG